MTKEKDVKFDDLQEHASEAAIVANQKVLNAKLDFIIETLAAKK